MKIDKKSLFCQLNDLTFKIKLSVTGSKQCQYTFGLLNNLTIRTQTKKNNISSLVCT